MEEVWHDIKGYEGLYQISNYGNVKTVERTVHNPGVLGDGEYRKVHEMIRKHNIMKGYHCISLSADKHVKVFRVARLVMDAFGTPAPSDKHQITYLDGNKDNLHISNLAWMLPADVMKLAGENGRVKQPSEERRKQVSEQFKTQWKNEEYRKARTQNIRERWNNPELREKTLLSMREAGRKRREHNAAMKAAKPKSEPYHVPDLPGEMWADVIGHEGQYKISNLGRIKSCDRILPHKEHGTWHIRERLLRQGKYGPGRKKYLHVQLHIGGGKMVQCPIHRAVAEAFIPNPLNLPQVNHIDGNTENNVVTNLEWVTEKENVEHAWRTGLCENIVKVKQKPVVNVDTGERYESVAAAEKAFAQKTTGAIGHALNGKTKTAYGYRWAYAGTEDNGNG